MVADREEEGLTGAKYRPLTDMWILARTKEHYYGAYPGGFLWRAKVLLPGEMCHLCSGTVRGDFTVDIDPKTEPDLIADARHTGLPNESFDAVLIDPPYSPEHAKNYNYQGYPKPKHLLQEAWRLVRPGGRIGMLHFLFPQPPTKEARLLALVGVVTGCNGKIRVFTVYEKPHVQTEKEQSSRHQDIMSYMEEKA